jgi:hypothetical protein
MGLPASNHMNLRLDLKKLVMSLSCKALAIAFLAEKLDVKIGQTVEVIA